jgi:two-component system, OmpR family, response regulator
MRILLVEDNYQIAQSLKDALEKQYYTIDLAADGAIGLQCIECITYDLILLDLMLPKIDGITLCRKIRAKRLTTPILILTAKDSSIDRVLGLDVGADDYMVKPFDLPELFARIRALLRRGNIGASPLLTWEYLELDPSIFIARYQENTLKLTTKEYAILELLLRSGNRILSRGDILDRLWTFEDPPHEDAVKFHIKELRKKLKIAGAPANLIETVYGVGYRLKVI